MALSSPCLGLFVPRFKLFSWACAKGSVWGTPDLPYIPGLQQKARRSFALLLRRMSPSEWNGQENDFTFLNSLWFSAGALTLQGRLQKSKAVTRQDLNYRSFFGPNRGRLLASLGWSPQKNKQTTNQGLDLLWIWERRPPGDHRKWGG